MSKTLLPFAQRILFRSVSFEIGRYGVRRGPRNRDDGYDSDPDPDILVTNDKPLRRTLRAAPHLGAHCRLLSVEVFGLELEELDDSYVGMIVRDVLAGCPNITQLDVWTQKDPELIAEQVYKQFSEAGRQLEELEGYYSGLECWNFLLQSRMLLHLTLNNADTPTFIQSWDRSEPFPFSLTSLTLRYVDDGAPIFIAATANATSTLQHLELTAGLFALLDVRMTLSSLTALSHLTLHVEESLTRQDFKALSLSLSVCATPSLDLSGTKLPLSLFAEARFHPSLAALRIIEHDTQALNVIRWLCGSNNFNFQELTVWYARGVKEAREISALGALCERKGLQFAWSGHVL
ncbi:hypothetical protein BCR35DRAFT_331610 [Leucosporidium creatinivorum]|uniref:F-box domain-containing protein n=1 Tax=Leucosporidium creatinivorum TaxID=106004 RepID=A0A1Y2FE06_9BASI|nr:hypothetical protein BCR35DRAFT_331610 [Leucosporidium creatinivorum]